MPKSLVLLAALVAGPAFAAPAPAGDMLTLAAYREGRAAGGAAAAASERYLDGALHGVLMVDEAMRSGGGSIFCLDEAHLEDGTPDLGRLRAEFVAWLDDPAASGSNLPETREAPLAMFALGFFAKNFACADAAGEAEGQEEDLGSVLRRTQPQ
jgi:hypothetical protein